MRRPIAQRPAILSSVWRNSRWTWRKLHLPIDANSGMIVAQILTDQNTDNPSQVGPLLTQIKKEIEKVIADGAYDGAPTYRTISQHGCDIEVVIPPRKTAVPITESCRPTQRDRHIEMINTEGRMVLSTCGAKNERSFFLVEFAPNRSPLYALLKLWTQLASRHVENAS